MRRIILFFFVFIILLTFVMADTPKYSFGSMQETKNLVINPGKEISTKIYFYNVYGDRNTHIRLDIEKPEEWNIKITPSIEEVTYDVSGELLNFKENLVIEPSEILKEPLEDSEKIKYIKSKEGFVGSNFVEVKIKIPENTELGRQETIKVNAIAFWLGSGGGVSIEQERTFEYNIKVLSDKFYEKKVTNIEEETKNSLASITGAAIGTTIKENFSLVIFFIIIILIIAIGIVILKKKNRKN